MSWLALNAGGVVRVEVAVKDVPFCSYSLIELLEDNRRDVLFSSAMAEHMPRMGFLLR